MPRLSSFRSTYAAHNRFAFTLVELLAVIAILAILVTILILVVGSVKKAGNKARSVSNLRQIHQGLALYDIEHRGLPRLTLFSNGVDQEPFWNHRILPYMGVSSTPEDPADPWRSQQRMPDFFYDPAEPNSNKRRGDYGVFYHNDHGPVRKSIARQSYRIAELINPSRTPLVATAQDMSGGKNSGGFYVLNSPAPAGTGSELSSRHDGMGIVAFADGHVLTIEKNKFYADYMPWTND